MITDNEFLRIVSFLKQRYGIDMSQKGYNEWQAGKLFEIGWVEFF